MHKFMKKAGAAVMAASMAINGMAIGAVNIFAADSAKYEFEDAAVTGTIAVTDDSAASGGKILFMKEDGTISMEVEAPSTGMYTLSIYAMGEGGDKIQTLAINGVDQGNISIAESKTYSPTSMTVKLNEGKNTVTISKSWGWSKFDYLTVEAAELKPIKATQTTCCDVNATDETRALMSYLASVYGNGIISGQQEIYSGGPHGLEQEFEYLEKLTGHMPAIRGFDYGNFCCPAFGSDDGSTERVIDWVKNKNGIATASFHLNVPKDTASYNIGDRIDWGQTTYSQITDFSPSKVVVEGTKENQYYMQALTTLAKEFKELEAEGVPVMWRPLHEAEGGGGETGSWFWWGREGSEAYKELWKFTYKVLTEDFDCHNLIWVWNSYNYEYSQDWYPGDEYVDIIGYDKYNCSDWSTGTKKAYHNDSAISSTFYGIMDKYDSTKMIAMAENDSFSTVENLTSEKAGWLYFMTWYDAGGSAESDNPNFLSDPIFNTEEDTIAMYQSEYCVTLDELPADLYSKETPKPDPIETKPTTTKDPANTTTVATTEADPSKDYGKVIYDKTKKSYQITLPKEAKEFYIDVELPKNVTYANGGLGVTIPLDGEYYWSNIQWEATKSGSVKVNVVDNLFNITLGTDEIEDEELFAKLKAELGKATVYEGQVWYAGEGDKAADTDGVKIISAYLKDESTTTVTTTTKPAEPATGGDDIKVSMYGDANCDNEVSVADATLILQYLGNKDKYTLSEQGAKNADCYNPGDGLSTMDALAIQKLDAGAIKELPEIVAE
ncbi:MAG: glycoside hydrolase [Ruminococcus sp.]|nr:glycoside hydrolase [Ruminococcus sp.]MDE6783760.1 glycoside hydrolase [Ruminococcus sp.]